MDDLNNNTIHSIMEYVLSIYLAKEHDKGLRREFGAQEGERNLMQKDCHRLKARITEVENTMKEMLESVDKLQADLDEANAVKDNLEDRAKAAEYRVFELHMQIQEL